MALRGLSARSAFKTTVSSHAPSADTNATKTLAAVAGKRWSINEIDATFEPNAGSLSGAGLTITGLAGDDYAVILPTTAGLYRFVFDEPLVGDVNTAVVITATVTVGTAKLNVQHSENAN